MLWRNKAVWLRVNEFRRSKSRLEVQSLKLNNIISKFLCLAFKREYSAASMREFSQELCLILNVVALDAGMFAEAVYNEGLN